jgi:hypothetical protein
VVVLKAAAHDWPRHWYARPGFATVGSVWDVSRPVGPPFKGPHRACEWWGKVVAPQTGASNQSSR